MTAIVVNKNVKFPHDEMISACCEELKAFHVWCNTSYNKAYIDFKTNKMISASERAPSPFKFCPFCNTEIKATYNELRS